MWVGQAHYFSGATITYSGGVSWGSGWNFAKVAKKVIIKRPLEKKTFLIQLNWPAHHYKVELPQFKRDAYAHAFLLAANRTGKLLTEIFRYGKQNILGIRLEGNINGFLCNIIRLVSEWVCDWSDTKNH